MILRHTLSYTIVKFFPAMASMAALMVFTRLMSPDQFGEYSLTVNLATTLVAILGNFLVIGLGRFEPAANTVTEKMQLHSTVIASALLLSIAVAVLTGGLGFFNILPPLSINYYFFVVLFFVLFFALLSQKLINANLKPKAYGVSLALKNILFLVVGTVCLLADYGVYSLLASLAIATLFASLPALSLWVKPNWDSFDFTVLKQLWIYGAPLTLLYLFVMIISFSDRVFIDVMLGSDSVGLYSAGYDLTQYTIAIIASIVHLAAFPIILKAYENEGEEAVRELLSISIRILLFIMLPVTLGFVAVKEEISEIFLGGAFSLASISLIPILALSVLLSTIKSYYFDYAFQITKTTWLQTIPPLLAALLNCFLNYFLILKIGIIGAAYATLIAYFFYLILTVILSKKVFKFPVFPWVFAFKVSLSSMIMMIAVSLLNSDFGLIFSLILKIFIGVVVFGACVFVFMRDDLVTLLKNAKAMKGIDNVL
ncbi:oligosaccharide flippase family protein [Denitrificimonas caeni]|uniref:oligosaccharide flippase family protein n=1 Tax=Denitrificimonas caeni TaxID=521720 RepID=UPI0003B59BF2|nr:polysaccharide biosynthesis C-terminal domain-containing protein [Denitrificimonas caeni]